MFNAEGSPTKNVTVTVSGIPNFLGTEILRGERERELSMAIYSSKYPRGSIYFLYLMALRVIWL